MLVTTAGWVYTKSKLKLVRQLFPGRSLPYPRGTKLGKFERDWTTTTQVIQPTHIDGSKIILHSHTNSTQLVNHFLYCAITPNSGIFVFNCITYLTLSIQLNSKTPAIIPDVIHTVPTPNSLCSRTLP